MNDNWIDDRKPDKMKIAAFVTDFSLDVSPWLCAILNGMSERQCRIDLFMSKAGTPPPFGPNIRVFNLSNPALTCSGRQEPVRYASIPFAHLLPGSSVEIVQSLASLNHYQACIGFESRGLLLAKIAADASKCPLVYHSFELYQPDFPGVWGDQIQDIKNHEAKLISQVDLFLIQDQTRYEEYFRLLNTTHRPRQTILFPISLPPSAIEPRPRRWHQRYGLDPRTKVVFYIGQLGVNRFLDQIIQAAQSFRDDQILILHGPCYGNAKRIDELTALDTRHKVRISSEIVRWDQIPILTASADIGLVFYRPQVINDSTTGRSSDKLARYLQSSIPVICSDFPTFRADVDRFQYGLCCSDFSRLPTLVNQICGDYDRYRLGAKEAFDRVFNLNLYLDPILDCIRQRIRPSAHVSLTDCPGIDSGLAEIRGRIQRQQLDEAADCAGTLCRQYPNDPRSWDMYGSIDALRQNLVAAESWFKRAFLLQGVDPIADSAPIATPQVQDNAAPYKPLLKNGRPRFSFVMIVLNGMPFIEYSLRSIYDFAHDIIIVEGAVKDCLAAARPDGSSRDGTVEFLRSFPDPQKKIRLIQGLWPEKCQMQNKALEFVTGDYVWLIDSDEVYKPQDLQTLRDLLDKDPTITQVNFIPDNFWKGLDYIFVSPRFFQTDHHTRRLFKYVPGAVFTTHRPPTLVWPGSNQTTEQMHLLDGFQTRKMGLIFYHYSYVLEEQVAQKNAYYAKQWGEVISGVSRREWFERCYKAWTPQNREQIEAKYPVWINDRNSRTQPFRGTHPPVMEEFRLRLRRATSSVSQDEMSCPPVEASRESGLAGSASGSKVKVACDYEISGATVGTESKFAAEIRKLFARIRPRKIIETGTYLGRGTTTIIARALEEQGISDAVFCTIEVNPKNWRQAKEYFLAAGLNVHAILGLSIPRSMLPSPDQIQKQTVSDLGREDIFVDHRPGERVGAYYRETDFPDVPDNRLYECLRAFRFRPDFVLLDSAGHIGAIEFNYLFEHLQGPCHIALDDIYHIKHHQNFLRMQKDPRFEILAVSKEKFGFCIARYTPQPVSERDPVRRIVWLRTDSIGDALLSASMLPHIQRRFDDARITVVCQQHIAELYESCPHVETVITVPCEHRWESDAQYRQFLGKIRAGNPDVLLNSTWATHGMADLAGLEFIPRRIALRQVRNAAYTQILPTDPAPMPELHRHRDFLRGLGIEVDSLMPAVWLTNEDEQFADHLLRQHGLDPERTVALFAGTRTPHRQYEYYGQAIRSVCAENRLSILALGGAGDLGVNQRNMIASGAGGLNLSGRCTLRQTAALLRRCRLAVGAETGLAHLACAVGTPNVILLGGGHFGRFMPYSPLTTIAALPLDCYGCDWKCRHPCIHCVRDLDPGVLAYAFRQALSCDSNDIRVCVQGPSLWPHHPDRPRWQECQSWLEGQPIRILTCNETATPETPTRVAAEAMTRK